MCYKIKQKGKKNSHHEKTSANPPRGDGVWALGCPPDLFIMIFTMLKETLFLLIKSKERGYNLFERKRRENEASR